MRSMLKREFGVVTINTNKGFVAVNAIGTFEMYGHTFMVHHSIEYPELYGVSEMSTGRNVLGYVYEDIDDAYEKALERLTRMRAHLATCIGTALVDSGTFINRGGILITINCLL